MHHRFFFKLEIILIIFIFSSNGQPCPCNINVGVLQCNVINASPTINTNLCSSNVYSSISIIYTGTVLLTIIAPSIQPIVITPVDGNNSNVIQISEINTNANRIQIQISLSSNQVLVPLFPTSSSIIAPMGTLSINVMQNIPDAINFKVFESLNSNNVILANYEVIFNTTNTNSGSLSLPNLIYGFINLTSLTISGNNHILVVNSTQMPSSITVNQLSLKNLQLYNQILYNFYNLQQYSIEECTYNKNSLFLNSTQKYNISLEMKNNNPLDTILPFGNDAFKQLGTLTSLTLIDPILNSSCLPAIQYLLYPATVLINLSKYYKSDLINWGAMKPIFWQLTIQNIQDLNVFPPIFINKFQAINQVTFQGTFNLEKQDICIFVGMIRQPQAINPILILNSPQQGSNNWDTCADTYITAINQDSINNLICEPDNTLQDCQQWAEATTECSLISYENACGQIERYGNNFFYNNSYLYQFFTQELWLNNQTTYPSKPPISKEDSINIGAIIGAICGLLVAIIILAVTIFLIYRYRQNEAKKTVYSTPEGKYKPSAFDSTHVSIATSKTSQSSRYALEQSFFPPMHPNDEIAPPLYTAPSESIRSLSAYHAPSAPPAPRGSVSTQATHLYETVDS